MRGFYPTGKEIPVNGFKPSGALIKAMLIHSAQNMNSIIDGNGGTYAINTPSVHAGYGRVQLNKGLTAPTYIHTYIHTNIQRYTLFCLPLLLFLTFFF